MEGFCRRGLWKCLSEALCAMFAELRQVHNMFCTLVLRKRFADAFRGSSSGRAIFSTQKYFAPNFYVASFPIDSSPDVPTGVQRTQPFSCCACSMFRIIPTCVQFSCLFSQRYVPKSKRLNSVIASRSHAYCRPASRSPMPVLLGSRTNSFKL